jgi:hypothetical protein
MSTSGKAGLAYAVLMLAYWEFISYADLDGGALDTHVWIFGGLLLLGALAAPVYAAARLRS